MTNARGSRGPRGPRAMAGESTLRDVLMGFLRGQDLIRKDGIHEVADINLCGYEIKFRRSVVMRVKRPPKISATTCLTGRVIVHQSLVVRAPRADSPTEPDVLMDATWTADEDLRLHIFVKGSWVNMLLTAIDSSYAVSPTLQ